MALLPGQIVDGKYRVVRMIGEGGMGAVYEGENARIGRRVAIKVMHAEAIANSDLLRRFQREAMAAAKIGSAHIVDVLDLGDLPNGESYMVMEYLEGESLGARIAAGRLHATDAALIAHQLLEGLGAMHVAGIVHRDLKPANIFLARTTKGEVVKILDFGVSKFTSLPDDPELMTQSGAVMGTPHYMSPEQARGNNKEVDARTDIYALGVILYRAMSGELPFDGENFHELLFKIALEEARTLESLVPEIDPGFAQIIMRAMSREAAARYQTANEMRAAIEEWGRSQGRPSLAFDRTVRTSGRMVPSTPVVVSVNPSSQSERQKAATEGKSTPTAWSESDAANAKKAKNDAARKESLPSNHKGGTLAASPAGVSAEAKSSPSPSGAPPSAAAPKNRSLVFGVAIGGALLVAASLAFVVKGNGDSKAAAPAPPTAPTQTESPVLTPPLPAPPATTDPPAPTASAVPPSSAAPADTASAARVTSPRPLPVPAKTATPPAPPSATVAAASPPPSAAPPTAPASSVHGRKIRTDL